MYRSVLLQLWMCTVCVCLAPSKAKGGRQISLELLQAVGRSPGSKCESSARTELIALSHLILPASETWNFITCLYQLHFCQEQGNNAPLFEEKFQRSQEQNLWTHANQVQWCSKNMQKPHKLEMLLTDLTKCWSHFSLSVQYVICQGESLTTVRYAHLACYLVVTCQRFAERVDEFGTQ